jgi:hypothetical protein
MTKSKSNPHIQSIKADAARVRYGYPTNLYDILKSELRKTELLKQHLVEKDELINKKVSYTQELEKQLAQEQRQNQDLSKRCEQERVYSACLSQTMLRASQETSFLRNQVNEFRKANTALTEELHKRAATIRNLEKENHHFRDVLIEVSSRMRNARHDASTQTQEESAEDAHSQHPNNYEEPPAYSPQESLPLQNTVTATPRPACQPRRSILKTSSTNHIYFWNSELHPRVSSPDFKARVKRQIHLEQLALARKSYLVSTESLATIENTKQNSQSLDFTSRRRMHEEEEHSWLAKRAGKMMGMMRMA